MTRTVGLLLGLALLNGCARYQGTVEEISFVTHDGVVLHGSLVFPENHVGTVAVVLHGAEAATRSLAYRMHANVLLKRGVAVLLYDKRGAGDSGGDHDTATYADLIEDALAAIRWLRSRPDIGASSIGLVGTSESGWFTPEIAERAGDMAFVFNKAGSCLTWRETNAWAIHNELLAAGVDPAAAWAQVDVFRALWAHNMTPTADGKVAMAKTLQAWAGRSDTRLPPELRRVSAAHVQDISSLRATPRCWGISRRA